MRYFIPAPFKDFCNRFVISSHLCILLHQCWLNITSTVCLENYAINFPSETFPNWVLNFNNWAREKKASVVSKMTQKDNMLSVYELDRSRQINPRYKTNLNPGQSSPQFPSSSFSFSSLSSFLLFRSSSSLSL